MLLVKLIEIVEEAGIDLSSSEEWEDEIYQKNLSDEEIKHLLGLWP